jgi:hypothetical protein
MCSYRFHRGAKAFAGGTLSTAALFVQTAILSLAGGGTDC